MIRSVKIIFSVSILLIFGCGLWMLNQIRTELADSRLQENALSSLETQIALSQTANSEDFDEQNGSLGKILDLAEGISLLVQELSEQSPSVEPVDWDSMAESLKQIEVLLAWQLLANQAPGNSGKMESLRVLSEYDQNFQGLDLSCERHGELDEDGKCIYPTNVWFKWMVLEGTTLTWIDARGAYLKDAKLRDTVVNFSNFDGADFGRVDFSDIPLSFQNAIILV